MWNCNWGYGFGGGGWFGHGFIGLLFGLLVIAALVFLIVVTVRAFVPRRNPERRDRDDSLDILKTKFARGEISSQEYTRMKEILTG